eukprot:scaffold8271_cov171-Amphora_coffeaeformis.AAC.7
MVDDDVAATEVNNWIDADVWKYYQLGLVLGIVLITTLSLVFPGPRIDDAVQVEKAAAASHEDDDNNNNNNTSSTNEHDASKTPIIPPTPSTSAPTQSNNRNTHGGGGGDNNWSPHGQLNTAVYVVLIGTTLYILNHEYPGLFMDILTRFFPREKALLWGA